MTIALPSNKSFGLLLLKMTHQHSMRLDAADLRYTSTLSGNYFGFDKPSPVVNWGRGVDVKIIHVDEHVKTKSGMFQVKKNTKTKQK